jgi:hypothetical protein
MNPARLLLVFLRAFGGAALLLGLAFWLGFARSLTALHMRLGIALVLCLWAMSVLAWWRTARLGPSAFAVIYGLVILFFGVTHAGMLPGAFHWIVQFAHLALGVGAVAIGGQLASGVSRRGASVARPESARSGSDGHTMVT